MLVLLMWLVPHRRHSRRGDGDMEDGCIYTLDGIGNESILNFQDVLCKRQHYKVLAVT
jgi:hypothetical protein